MPQLPLGGRGVAEVLGHSRTDKSTLFTLLADMAPRTCQAHISDANLPYDSIMLLIST